MNIASLADERARFLNSLHALTNAAQRVGMYKREAAKAGRGADVKRYTANLADLNSDRRRLKTKIRRIDRQIGE